MQARGHHGKTKMAAITKPLAFLVLVTGLVLLLNVSCSGQNTTDENGKLSTPTPLNKNVNPTQNQHGVQIKDNNHARYAAVKRQTERKLQAINNMIHHLETIVTTVHRRRQLNMAKEQLLKRRRRLEKVLEHIEMVKRMRKIEPSKPSIVMRKKEEVGPKTNLKKPVPKAKKKTHPRNRSNAHSSLNIKTGQHNNIRGGLEKRQKTKFKKHKQKPHQNDTINEQMQTTKNKIGSKYSRDNNDTSSHGFLKHGTNITKIVKMNHIANSKSDITEKMKMKRLIKKEIGILKNMGKKMEGVAEGEQVRQQKAKMINRISYLEKMLEKIERSERKRRIEPPKIISRVVNRQKAENNTHFTKPTQKASEKIQLKSRNNSLSFPNAKIEQHNVTDGLRKDRKKEIETHPENQTSLAKDTENEQIQSENNSFRSNNTRVNNSIDTLPNSNNDNITLAAISSTQSTVNNNITDTVTTTNYIMTTSTIQDKVSTTSQPINDNTTKDDTNRYKSVVKTGDVFRIFENLLTEMKNKTGSRETNDSLKQSEKVIGKKNNKIVIVKFPVKQKASTSEDDSKWDELFSSVTTTDIPSGNHNFILTKNEEFYYDDDDQNV